MTDTNNLPPTKRAFVFCPRTREYLGELEAYLSPLEETYPLPSNATFVDPGSDPGPHKTRRLVQDGTGWDVVDDYRYIMLWDTTTAQPLPNTLALGEVPSTSVTHLAPPGYALDECRCSVWDDAAQAWSVAPDYSRCTLWIKATAQRAASLQPGVALPDTLTTLQPPMGEHVCALWNEGTQAWDAVPDYRGFRYWTEDGMIHEITERGITPPANYLASPPATAIPL
jgi:hypothetical protein